MPVFCSDATNLSNKSINLDEIIRENFTIKVQGLIKNKKLAMKRKRRPSIEGTSPPMVLTNPLTGSREGKRHFTLPSDINITILKKKRKYNSLSCRYKAKPSTVT